VPGPPGRVYGLDMIDEMLALAEQNKRKSPGGSHFPKTTPRFVALSTGYRRAPVAHACLYSTSAFGILQYSGDGLRVINCKILGGGYGIYLSRTSASNVGNLFITGCSIESQAFYGSGFHRSIRRIFS